MRELHSKLISDKNFEPRKGQRDLLCSNKESLRCPFLGVKNIEEQVDNCFSVEELENISDLGIVLQEIRNRIISEGYIIEDLRNELYGRDYNLNN